MTATSLPCATRPDRPIPPPLLDMLRRVDAAAGALGIEYFVGGALARDLVLWHVFGQDTGRATRDVDLGIHIDDWEVFAALKAGLIRDGHFTAQPRMAHRLIYRTAAGPGGIPLDLLPFGGIETADATIAWPPGMEIVMNVAGFAETRRAALRVEVASGLFIPVASLPALAILKLIAWRDRRLETSKDATDFLLIARHYGAAGNLDRLYETESALLVAADFDPQLAGAMLLGQDAAAVSSPRTAQAVISILGQTELRQGLEDQLLRATLSAGSDGAEVARYLAAFHGGFTARLGP